MLYDALIKFFAAPLAVAVIMYVLVHLQLLFLHKLLNVELSHKIRSRICIATFISSFLAVILLVVLKEYFKLHLNTGSS